MRLQGYLSQEAQDVPSSFAEGCVSPSGLGGPFDPSSVWVCFGKFVSWPCPVFMCCHHTLTLSCVVSYLFF